MALFRLHVYVRAWCPLKGGGARWWGFSEGFIFFLDGYEDEGEELRGCAVDGERGKKVALIVFHGSFTFTFPFWCVLGTYFEVPVGRQQICHVGHIMFLFFLNSLWGRRIVRMLICHVTVLVQQDMCVPLSQFGCVGTEARRKK